MPCALDACLFAKNSYGTLIFLEQTKNEPNVSVHAAGESCGARLLQGAWTSLFVDLFPKSNRLIGGGIRLPC